MNQPTPAAGPDRITLGQVAGAAGIGAGLALTTPLSLAGLVWSIEHVTVPALRWLLDSPLAAAVAIGGATVLALTALLALELRRVGGSWPTRAELAEMVEAPQWLVQLRARLGGTR